MCTRLAETPDSPSFESLNRAFDTVFQYGKMSLGLVVPLEGYGFSAVPSMEQHLERVQLAESLGFSAVWIRDVPFNVTSFGDAGQIFDPFVYLGLLAGQTNSIALGVASIVLPLRHPAHVAKAAASVDQLSGGRLLLGVASGDRPEEYPALNLPYEERGKRFRESYEYIRNMASTRASFDNIHGSPRPNMDLLPKPHGTRLPLLITGGSQQTPDWVAQNGDGWMTYPRNLGMQARVVREWRTRVKAHGLRPKPIMQPLHIDLVEDDEAPPEPIHLGFRSGVRALKKHLNFLEQTGVNHVALNLRFNKIAPETTMKRLADDILPSFE